MATKSALSIDLSKEEWIVVLHGLTLATASGFRLSNRAGVTAQINEMYKAEAMKAQALKNRILAVIS